MKEKNQRLLFNNSIFNILFTIANIVLPFAIAVYVSRVLLPSGLGKIEYANTIVSYFVIFASLGLPSYGIKEIGKLNAESEIRQTFSELFLINAFGTIVATILFMFFVLIVPSIKRSICLYLILGMQIPFTIFNIDWFYRGVENYKQITIRSVCVRVVALILTFVLVHKSGDIYIYALVVSLTLVANCLIGFFLLKNNRCIYLKGLNIKKHIKPILYLFLAVFCSTIYSNIDITMLGVMKDDATVGIYSNAHRIVNTVITFCAAITGAFLPRMSLLYETDKKKFIGLLNNGIEIVLFFSIPVALGVFLLSPNAILLFFGNPFFNSNVTLRIFSILIVIKSLGDLLCFQTVVCIGKEKVFLPFALISMLINIVLNSIWIPFFAENGAAFASVISEIVYNSLVLSFVKKHINFTICIENVFKDVIATLAMGIIVYLISISSLSNLLICIFSLIAGLSIYVLLSIVLKNNVVIKFKDMIKTKLK